MSFDIVKGLAKAKSKKKRRSRKSVYEKQREEETIRNATQRGYLRRMTMEFLNNNIGGRSDCDLSKIGYLNVTNSQLSSLGVLEMCVNLCICILPGNYITEFDALENCVNLWVLDLHGNQIKKIPEEKFWVALKKLQILLLHDNGISKLETIHHLSSSPSLLVLTLYDTPLSLKKNYRHHVVNGVWCLKALDHHVISDEEIIEDTKMEGKFTAMQNNFRINLDHGLQREFTYEEAVKHIEQFMARINKIQAKFSPVLMIQKRLRGYCTRKKYKFMMAKRIWAATTIQRFYRFAKGITKSRHNLLPPPSSPLASTYPSTSSLNREGTSYLNREGNDSQENDAAGWDGMQMRRSSAMKSTNIMRVNSIRLPTGHLQPDHEVDSSLSRDTPAWTPERLPRGLTRSFNFPTSSLGTDCRNSRELEDWMSGVEQAGEDSFHGHESAYNDDDEENRKKKIKRRMTIDLVKLESTALEAIQSATCAMDINSRLGQQSKTNALSKQREKPSKDSKMGISTNGKQSKEWDAIVEKEIVEKKEEEAEAAEDIEDLHRRRMKPEMIGKYRTVRVFLGPILQPKGRPVVVVDGKNDDDDDTMGFRLRGMMPPRQKSEPVVEMLLSKKEVGEDMRSALRQQKQESRGKRAKQVVRRSRGLGNDQRLFLRTHGTMGLACLRAVHRAYGDRERAREQAYKAEHVAEMKGKREQVVEVLRAMKQDYQEGVVRSRIHEGVQIADALRENEKKQEEEHGKVSTRRAAAVVRERGRKAEGKFEKAFVSQQSSVSQALRAHDRAELSRERLAKVTEAVRHEREATLKQQALVRKFMEHRQLVRQTETAKAKAELDAKMVHEASRRFAEVETRVARQTKNRLAQIKEFYPLPPVNAPATDTPLAILSPGNYSPWEAALQRDSRQYLSNSETCSQKPLEPLML